MLLTQVDKEVAEVVNREKAAAAAGETARQYVRRTLREEGREQHHGSRISYATKLVGAFAMTALMTALIAASILAVVWEGQFQEYTRENMQVLANKTASQIAERYADAQAFTPSVLSYVSATSAVYTDVAIQVLNAENTTVYDDSWSLSHAGSDVALTLATAREQAASAPITVDGQFVGTVRIWVFGTGELLTQNDIDFRVNSYKAIAIAAIVAILIAVLVGFFVARGLIGPVKKVTETAAAVKGGDLAARTGMEGNDEISQLGETFDDMADSIQRDRELERRLTTDVAHELRTPLMGIQATVEAIIDGVFQADEERLAAINSETMRLKRLVEALLNLSRLESGSVPFHEQRVDLAELMAGLFMSLEPLLETAELSPYFGYDEDVVVDGDSDMLRQAVANLVSNAVRYNEAGGKVSLEVRKRGDMAAVSVSDTGIGISPEDQEMVFSRFWRADEGRNRAAGGLGVGLAVVKEIMDYHNGTIEIQSEVGKGTTFTLLIPLHIDKPVKVQKTLTGKMRLPKELKESKDSKEPKASKTPKERKA